MRQFWTVFEAATNINNNEDWRAIFGKVSNRLKDEELILRFFALLYRGEGYKKPMREFLDGFLDENRYLDVVVEEQLTKEFSSAISLVHASLGEKAFRVGASLNAAIFDSVMVGIARRLRSGAVTKPEKLQLVYAKLIGNEDYVAAYIRATSDDESVRNRLRISTESFANVP